MSTRRQNSSKVRGRRPWSLLTTVVALLLTLTLLPAIPAAAQTPLGATLVSGGVQFALFSQHATRVELWIFATPTASTPTSTHVLTKTDPTNHIWTVTVSGAGAGTLYGYRVWGPNWPYNASWTAGSSAGFLSHVDASGNRFNPNKLLTDPYAKAVTGEPVRVLDTGTGEYHYSSAILGGTNTYGFLDSAGVMPKSIVIDDDYDWEGDTAPDTPMSESVVYEVHLRGFSRNDSSLSTSLRGTYAGFASKASYLADLGVTAVELLPIHEYPQYDDPVGGATADRVNYWGYMTTQFFAPNREYLCTDFSSCNYTAGEQVDAFKDMVKALHDEGIEVWLDVVYNHSFEGGGCAGNPVRYINLRGIDNQNYYTLADSKDCYWESTGTGNNLNASRPAVRKLILDSLTYWIDEMRVDGFRFDLAYALGREGNDGRVYNPSAQTLIDIAQLGQTKGVKMVAEAWDTGGYGVGTFPSGWYEWNGLWRDNVRKWTKGDNSQAGSLGASITATWSGFGSPPESVNFVTAHDGFSLNDLVSYNSKQNGTGPCNPTGADPGSGSNSNDSWDHGGDGVVQARQIRNFATHLLLHQGVPMIVAGDEMRQTYYGNNNVYMADNTCGWTNWSNLTTHAGTQKFFSRLIHFRRNHEALTRTTHAAGVDHDSDGYKDLSWHGVWPDTPDWSSTSHTLAFLLDGSAAEHGGSSDHPDLYVAYNAYWTDLTFNLPTAPNSKCWYLVADTADWAVGTGNIYYDPSVSVWNNQKLPKVTGSTWGMQARSTLVLAARTCTAAEPVRVDFTVYGYSTSVGQDLYVVGNVPELGNWDPTKAVKLNYVSSNQWTGPVFFTATTGQNVQFKFIMRSGGSTTWEGGSNRTYYVPSSGSGSTSGTWQ